MKVQSIAYPTYPASEYAALAFEVGDLCFGRTIDRRCSCWSDVMGGVFLCYVHGGGREVYHGGQVKRHTTADCGVEMQSLLTET